MSTFLAITPRDSLRHAFGAAVTQLAHRFACGHTPLAGGPGCSGASGERSQLVSLHANLADGEFAFNE